MKKEKNVAGTEPGSGEPDLTCESGDAAYLHANYLTRRKSGKLPLIRSLTQAADRQRARTGRHEREGTRRTTSGLTNGRQTKGIKRGLINLESGGASLYCTTGIFFFLSFFFIFLFSEPQSRGKKKANEEENEQSGGTRGRDRMRGLWGGIGKLKLLIDLRAARGLASRRRGAGWASILRM